MNLIFKMKFISSLLILSMGLPLSGLTNAADSGTLISGAEPQQDKQSFRDMRASKLIGSEVRNVHGESLGKIKDLIVDVNNERVYYAVLSFGGVLGLGNKLFAYPVRAFTQAAEGDKLVLNIDKDRLKAAPGFDKDSDWNDRRYREEVDRYHGKTVSIQPIPNQKLRRASEIMGKDVNDNHGKDMGKITDLVVNMGNGSIRYAVFSFDKSWDVNNMAVLISLRSFKLADGGDAVLDIDKAKLDNALKFEKSRWPNVGNPLFLVDVGGYLVLVDPQEYSTKGSAVAVFARLDVDRDNKVTLEEARQDNKVFGAWTEFDSQGAGAVSRDEFLSKYKALVNREVNDLRPLK